MQLVLSLFPGLGLLDMAFELEGWCVVKGPDLFFGRDVRHFVPPAGRFEGVIGGPPCQPFSQIRRLLRAAGRDTKAVNLIPEFTRCVEAADCDWFVMENNRNAPAPEPLGYVVRHYDVRDASCGGDTMRKRRFWFGTKDGRHLCLPSTPRTSVLPLERAVTRNCRIPEERHRQAKKLRGGLLPGDGRYMPIEDVCELQGLPRDYEKTTPYRLDILRIMLGNGVPIPMGRAIARAVKEATGATP